MNPADELRSLVADTASLASRYPDPVERERARARFTLPPDLRHLGPARRAPGAPRTVLPLEESTPPSDRRAPRVAIVTPDIVGPIRNGGIGSAYTSLARALADAGHEVTILYTLGQHCENGVITDWIDDYRRESIRFVPLPDPPGPAVFHGPRASYAAYRWLRGERFDVVHFPEWGGSAFCSVQAKRLGLGLERSLLTVGVHSPTLWHDLNDRRTVERLDQLERDFLERRSVEYADVVVSPSQYLLSWLDEWGWRTPDRSHVQPYVSPVAAPGGQPRGSREVKELVFFGRLESRKGIELFCDAVERLAIDGRLGGVTVTFLGKPGTVGGASGLDYVRSRAAGWSHPWAALSDRSQPEALDYLRSRPALAVTPSLADNTPNTVLECLGAGVPFVATRVGGIPEMIAEADHPAALVDADPRALAAALAARLAHGAAPLRPAVAPDEVRRRWIAWHEQQTGSDRPARAAGASRRPLVSVCLATRDRPRFLAPALASLERQSYDAFEVIVVDDGSETDEAKAHLESVATAFAARAGTLLREPQRFPGAARNTAAAHARGRYLLFMDDDNLALPAEIETLVAAAEHSGAAILTCGHDAFDREDSDPAYRWMPLGGTLPLALFVNCVGDTNMLVRREAFFEAGGFDEERGAGLVEDWAFFSKALMRGLRIDVVPEALFRYRLGAHGHGQRAPAYESYARPLKPVADVLPPGIALALFYAAGAARRSVGPSIQGAPPPAAEARPPRRRRTRDRLHELLVRSIADEPIASLDDGDGLADRFADGVPVDAFDSSTLSRVVALHQLEVMGAGQGILLRSSGDEPQLGLRPAGSFGAGPFLVRIDLTAPVETVAQLFWKTAKLRVYCEPHSVRTRIDPGRNVRYLRVDAKRTVGAWRFDPAAVAADFVLRRLEIRRERRD